MKDEKKENQVKYIAEILSRCDGKFINFVYSLVYNHYFKTSENE